MIKPKSKVPALEVKLINDSIWNLEKQRPDAFTLIIFYRGLHCPVCKKYLESLKPKLEDFSERGVNVVAISMDTEKRAKLSGEKWDVESVPIGYGMTEVKAREWGLYISNAIKDAEPAVFSEPAVFLVRPDGTLYFSSVQTMPFARPTLESLIKAIDFVTKEDYPARGGA
ncbi:peroxiredoxin-like family protein [Ulvibacter antarcticus]|uniref:Alkyl hydroperoxide reductase subunit AhpC n=1 Tax=Ulvibacter antarcticus TaxID=442714 RepID=A0A3L9Z602_9FLAO|nr:peroxiredoxin-like family protein [Ulvibacter antarcticus]RMA65695.1 alkyl hydroperoxide reductase subunit AhpC [Ulvibacter antarcticus]